MTTILLARHGESDWNLERRWQGHTDRPLTERGRQQARELASSLAAVDIAAAYASDLQRAWATAEIALGERGVAVERLQELRERSYGSWEGLRDEEVRDRFPEDHARWRAGEIGGVRGAHDGEPVADFLARVQRGMRRIAQRHPRETVLVVAHGGPIRVVHALLDELDFVQHRRSIPFVDNCAVVSCGVEEGVFTRLET